MSLSDVLRFSQLDTVGRRVFLRADLDRGLTSLGRLQDEVAVASLAGTLIALRNAGCKVALAGHFASSATMGAVRAALKPALGAELPLLSRDFLRQIGELDAGQLALAPNLNDFPEELRNDSRWALGIARAFDVYVGEAPLAAREVRASTVAVPALMPARAAGPFLGAMLDMTRDFVELVARPYTALVGGSGLERKAAFLRRLIEHVDTLLLGGKLANTFLVAKGWEPRGSEFEVGTLPLAREIMEAAAARGVRLVLPSDAVVIDDTPGRAGFVARDIDALASHEALLDLGPQTRASYRAVIAASETVLWNGLLGDERHDHTLEGTRDVLDAMVARPYSGVVGDRSVARAQTLELPAPFRSFATAGAASFDLLTGAALPGVESLRLPAFSPAPAFDLSAFGAA